MKHGRHEIPIPSWVDHEMQNWARWSLSAEYPGRPDWPGPRMARDLISRFYRAPDWGDDVRPLPPNEAHAQRVEQVVQKRMQPLERRIVDAEYVHPWASGRWLNEICAGDYRFDGRVSRAGIPDAGDREVCGGENAFFRRKASSQNAISSCDA